MTPARCTVVVPTRGAVEDLDRIADRLCGLSIDIAVMVVVNRRLDAASASRCAQLGRQLGGLVLVCPGGGVSRARNLALCLVGTDVLVFLDDDVIPTVGAIRRLTDRLLASDVGVVTGRIVPAETRARNGELYLRFATLDRGPVARTFDRQTAPPPTRTWEMGVGAAFAVHLPRLAAVEHPPAFDEALSNGRFCGGAEDVDFLLQCVLAGLRVEYLPEAVLAHEYPCRPGDLRRKMVSYARADGAFYAKWSHGLSVDGVLRDLEGWLARLRLHTRRRLRRQPSLPLITLLREPIDKGVGAAWWRFVR